MNWQIIFFILTYVPFRLPYLLFLLFSSSKHPPLHQLIKKITVNNLLSNDLSVSQLQLKDDLESFSKQKGFNKHTKWRQSYQLNILGAICHNNNKLQFISLNQNLKLYLVKGKIKMPTHDHDQELRIAIFCL